MGETCDKGTHEGAVKAAQTRKMHSSHWDSLNDGARKNLEAHGYSDIDEEGYGIKVKDGLTERHPPFAVKWDSEHAPANALKRYIAQHEPGIVKGMRHLNRDIHSIGGYKAAMRYLAQNAQAKLRG